MTIILTNDDGIDAPGISVMRQALMQVRGEAGVMIAPRDHLSGCSHQVNIRTKIHVDRRSERDIAIDSTPADCIRVGVTQLYPDASLVLSGVNAGCNMGSDIYPSGTIAAAREATLRRVPAIAISHFIHPDWEVDWPRAARMATLVLDKLLQDEIAPGTFWSVNLPHLPPEAPDPAFMVCDLCTRPLLTDYEQDGDTFLYVGDDIDRVSDPNTDVTICLGGNIAAVKLRLW